MNAEPFLPTILVVDDLPANIDLMNQVLRPYYRVKAAINGERAIAIASSEPRPDMILLDVMMPGVDGHETCERLKANPATASIPVIFVTAMSKEQDEQRGLSLGAVDYVTKPISPPIVLARVKTHLALHRQNVELERKVNERTEELAQTRLEVIRRLGRAAEFRDNETGLHVIRMSNYAYIIARKLGIAESWCQLLLNAAPMHDVGKIGIPDSILLKPGPLTPEEWVVMKKHPVIGAEIIGLETNELLRMSSEIALSHHEKWDGSGYPYGRKGTDIPLSARIVAIADVFDALTTERPYKTAWTVEAAVALVTENAGRHFDPELVDIFLSVLPEILEIKREHAEHPLPFRQIAAEESR